MEVLKLVAATCRTSKENQSRIYDELRCTGRLEPLAGPASDFLMDVDATVHTAASSAAYNASNVFVRLRGTPDGTRRKGQPGVTP
jgi:hypothetical protein